MSDKRGAAVKSSVGDASVQPERMLSKGKYKEAVKQAKLIHKAESTPESHRQLEHAYFLRAQQLLREGMPESAVEVSRHLLEFGVTDAKLVEEFAPLLVKLGLARRRLPDSGSTRVFPRRRTGSTDRGRSGRLASGAISSVVTANSGRRARPSSIEALSAETMPRRWSCRARHRPDLSAQRMEALGSRFIGFLQGRPRGGPGQLEPARPGTRTEANRR